MSNDNEPTGWGSVQADGFRLGPGDATAPDAVAALLAAFRRQGVNFDPSSVRDQQLRWRLSALATWSVSPPTELRAEDPTSRKLNDRVEALAIELRKAVEAAWEHAKDREEEPETDRVETCRFMFPNEESLREMQWACLTIELASQEGGRWVKDVAGKGRHKLWLYYAFAQQLHQVYVQLAQQRGFVERDGTAVGPFVDLMHECQDLLPAFFRHCDVRTTGNRVLQALAEENTDLGLKFP